MKMKGIFKVMAALVAINAVYAAETSPPQPTIQAKPAWMWTTALPGRNLKGKMMTITLNQGAAAFFPPHYDIPYNPDNPFTSSPPRTTNRPYPYPTQTDRPTTRPYHYPTRHYRPTTRPYPYPTRHYRPTTRPYHYPTRHYRPTTRPYHYPTRHYRPTTRPYPYPTRHYRPTTRPYPYPTRHYRPTTRPYPYPTRHYRPTTRPYPYPTRHYRPTTRPYRYSTPHPYSTTYPYWTTAPPTRGVSVCVRYLTDFAQLTETPLFTLSPSSKPLKMSVNRFGVYSLTMDPYGYYKQLMKPVVRLWPNVGPEVWSRVCFTVDSTKNVVQVFSGANMSIRKIMRSRYEWTGEPVIDFTGFDGQMTDLQMWNYPLRYKEIFSYMAGGYYGFYRGNVLTWAGIDYSIRGNTLLEDSYEQQAKARADKKGTQGRLKGQGKSGPLVRQEMKEENRLL